MRWCANAHKSVFLYTIMLFVFYPIVAKVILGKKCVSGTLVCASVWHNLGYNLTRNVSMCAKCVPCVFHRHIDNIIVPMYQLNT